MSSEVERLRKERANAAAAWEARNETLRREACSDLAAFDRAIAEAEAEAKSRGQRLAEKFIYRAGPGHQDADYLAFGRGIGAVYSNHPNVDFNERMGQVRGEFAEVIDAERADAAREQREACAEAVRKLTHHVSDHRRVELYAALDAILSAEPASP